MFKASIVTVCLNSASTIRDTIESVLSQDYSAIEYIIIDGGSTDETLKVIGEYGNSISAVISEPDKGIYDAMNKGIATATGDAIGLLNADDFYAHDKVLASVARLFEEDASLDACYSDLIYVDQIDTSRTVRYWQSNQFAPNAFSEGWNPPHPTFFVHRSVYERFGVFDLNYPIGGDVELMMRFLEVHKINTKYVPDVWVKMRMGGISNSNVKDILVQNRVVLRALKNHGLPANPARFFAHKVFSRGKQYWQRPN